MGNGRYGIIPTEYEAGENGMTEELHRPNITRGTRAFCFAAILAVICLVGGAGSCLNRVLDTAVFDYVTILLLSVSAWAAYRWLIVEYRYRVEDHVLYIDVVSGKRSRTLRSVKSSSDSVAN